MFSGLLLALSATALVVAPQASAATGVSAVGEALKKGPVYVDPGARAQLSPAQADALTKKIKDAGKPVFVAVLPAGETFPERGLLSAVRAQTGITGLYAVRLGEGFDAGADPRVMPRNAVQNLTSSVKVGGPVDANTQLNDFVDQALTQVKGNAPPPGAARPRPTAPRSAG